MLTKYFFPEIEATDIKCFSCKNGVWKDCPRCSGNVIYKGKTNLFACDWCGQVNRWDEVIFAIGREFFVNGRYCSETCRDTHNKSMKITRPEICKGPRRNAVIKAKNQIFKIGKSKSTISRFPQEIAIAMSILNNVSGEIRNENFKNSK